MSEDIINTVHPLDSQSPRTMLCSGVVALILSIVCVAIAVTSSDDSCQGHDKTGLTLDAWLLVVGIVGICTNVVTLSVLFYTTAYRDERAAMLYACLVMLHFFFNFCWCVTGVVILARAHGNCVTDGTSMGVMAVILIVLNFLSFWRLFCAPVVVAPSS